MGIKRVYMQYWRTTIRKKHSLSSSNQHALPYQSIYAIDEV